MLLLFVYRVNDNVVDICKSLEKLNKTLMCRCIDVVVEGKIKKKNNKNKIET